jgi:hypothetical protein
MQRADPIGLIALRLKDVPNFVMRDDFLEKTRRVLQDRAGNHCSNPDCRVLTSGPNAHPEKATKTGVAAHITAASSGGARYNPNLTTEQRRSAENGIWLCQTCAHFVDTDYLSYPVALLYDWKHLAEKEADDETNGRRGKLPQPPERENEIVQGWGCPFCGTAVGFEKSVCLGCHAEVVPGLTRFERQETARDGMMIGGILALLLLVALPNWLKSSFGWSIELFWGLGIYGLVIAGVVAAMGGVIFVNISESKRLQEPPRFFRHSIK